jgi:hypothetical protein
MKFASFTSAILLLCLAPGTYAQSGAPRAWQQRIAVTVDLPVPIVALESSNPFAIAVDQPPRLLTSTPPKKLDVQGTAVVAAYVDPKGDCLGGVPLELPFPGMTQSILDELKSVRFDPAKTGDGTVGSWVVLGLNIVGRIKETSIGGPTFEFPDPTAPPVPTTPLQAAPSGLLLRAPYEPQSSLTTFASPRRLKMKAPTQDADISVRALVHITSGGRCDRFVPLNIESGLHRWLSAFLATWRLDPALLDGAPHEAWVVYSARAQLKISSLDSTGVNLIRNRSFEPPSTEP